MSIAELFPNAGSYTGSTRSALTQKIPADVVASEKNELSIKSSSQPAISMQPINITQTLLTEDALSQIFNLVSTSQQSISTNKSDSDILTSNVVAAASAYAKVEDVKLYNQNSSVFLSE